MAALKDDCFAPEGEFLPVDRALALLTDRLGPVTGTEVVDLRAASGRFLAEDVVSDRDVPAHDNTAVDGYAVFFDDLDPVGVSRLPVTGRIAAGHPLERPARRGAALQVFTGARLPDGLDTVVMQEDCRIDGDRVVIGPGVKRGANRRRSGEDIRAASTILGAGRRLRAQDIGLAASVGRSRLTVFRRLRAVVFSTGDEVRDPAAEAEAGCVYDSNRYTMMAMLHDLGAEVGDLGIVGDRLEAVREAVREAAARHHLLVTSGGVSVGEEDHVRAAVETLGRLHLWRLAIKPGRPMAFGQVGETAFVGLPGNPVAAMVTFMRIARPVVILLSGGTDVTPPLFRVRAGFDFKGKKRGRREWLRARLVADADGGPIAVKFPAEGSGILSSMVEADGLVELPEEHGPVTKGAMVDFLSFNEVTR